jgi:DNA polymerase-3 subunit alpha
LGIENLSILRVCAEYIKKYKDTEFTEQDVYSIPDGDAKTYDLLASGLLTGVFQMETSGSAKKLITTIKPQSIEELSDISALNRPGPMTAGLDTQYAENKNNGYPPEDMPEQLATLLSKTYWTLVYQEQLMELVRTLAGFTLKEADDIRRVVGKKKKEELAKWEPELKRRLHEVGGLSPDYIDKLWSDILGYADYALTTYH